MAIELVTLIDPGGKGLLNQSDRYWLVFGVQATVPPQDNLPLPGTSTVAIGLLEDATGNALDYLELEIAGAQETSTTSGVYGFTFAVLRAHHLIVPPGYYLASFGRALAYQGTLEELSILM